MALPISQYVDPGVYTTEVIVPGALNIALTPVLPCVVAHGSRVRQAINEAVTRGLVAGETLTVAGSAPHLATLANRGDRSLDRTTVYADGVALSDAFVSYPAAYVDGTEAGTFDLSTDTAFGIELDNNLPITIVLSHNAAPAVAVSGAQVTVDATFGGTGGDAATRAEVAAAINLGLVAATSAAMGSSTGYGAAYASAASDNTTGVRITSPVTGRNSDVRVFAAAADAVIVSGSAALAVLFGGVLNADTEVQVSATVYDAAAVYTADYIALDDRVDALTQAGPQTVLRVGDNAGVTNYVEDVDYDFVSGALDWSNAAAPGVITQASLDSGAETFDLDPDDVIIVSLDGRAAVTIDLDGLASPPVGYADPSTPGAATAAEVAANINAVLANNAAYGARYAAVAAAAGGVVTITSPTDGTAGSITVSSPTTGSATSEVFGTTGTTVMGTGHRPGIGSLYYVSYTYTRLVADYNTPQQFFTLDNALAFTGPIDGSNPLAIGAELAFRNGSPSVLLSLVNDATSAGSPTTLEYQAALDAVGEKSTATDICVLSTDLAVQVALMQHVEDNSGPVAKNYRRGWFGMARSTPIGDKDTADSFVYRATRTLQPAADSPARGRLVLVAPPGVEGINKTVLRSNGTTQRLSLDSSYLALAIASRMAAFSSPAEALARKTIQGFDTTDGDFTPWVRAERAQLASNGVTVVTFDAGRLLLLDPTSTERGGGGLISFEQISASTQKDNINRKVTQALDANVIGLVPTDLADFRIDIKLIIANVLSGEIGDGAIAPFRDSNGVTRAVDLNRDIVVEQDPNDPTQYNVKWFFALKYPALRIFGEWSVDNPFFSAPGSA